MKELFTPNASLLSLPSERGMLARPINTTDMLRFLDYIGAPREARGNLDAIQVTMRLLQSHWDYIDQNGDSLPFSLSADSLAANVRRCDCLGPAQMGFYYEQRLFTECRFLIPRPMTEKDGLSLFRLMKTWEMNKATFRCSVIGAILEVNALHFRKRKERSDDCTYS